MSASTSTKQTNRIPENKHTKKRADDERIVENSLPTKRNLSRSLFTALKSLSPAKKKEEKKTEHIESVSISADSRWYVEGVLEERKKNDVWMCVWYEKKWSEASACEQRTPLKTINLLLQKLLEREINKNH